ncbi:MAG: adenylate/guanylate cyclase domain-containing protein [Usitatibacter sp.]
MKLVEHSTELPGRMLVALAACVAIFLVALGFTNFWHVLERKGYDLLSAIEAPNRSSLPITIVGIDEASFTEIGLQFSLWRGHHAKLIDQLTKAGALVIAFDVLMPEASKPEDDAALAAAIARAGNVVFAADLVYQESAHSRQWLRVEPLATFTEAGAANGFATVNPDIDGVVRNMPLGPDVLWRAIVKRANDRQPGLLALSEPVANAMIRYVGPDHTFPFVSYYQALEADTMLPPDAFRDQIVFIGRELKANTDARMAQGDLFYTPFTQSSGWLMPGVEIHANILETALRGAATAPAPRGWSIALLLFVTTLTAWSMRTWRPLLSGLVALCIVTAIAVLDWALFTRMNLWLPVFASMTSAVAVYLSVGGVAWFTERRRRSEMRRAFSLYVSPEVVDHVMANPQRLALGGERREVTMLFTDIAGFTTLTEELGAEQVTRVLNVHFSRATAIIKRHNGTVNRFIGDAIMAMWGAPIDDPRQAPNACLAACEMQQDMDELRKQFKAEGLPEIRMRVGIHSCTAVIGNLGSSDRFDYTAIGDGVNLAARLEGVNKLYKTGILISGETVARLEGAVQVRLVDRVIVKGKTEPVDIWTPCSDAEVIEASARAIAAYRARRWEESELLWRELLRRIPDDTIAELYLERIQRLRVTALEADWGGAVELEKL